MNIPHHPYFAKDTNLIRNFLIKIEIFLFFKYGNVLIFTILFLF